ncbi:MAG: serine/threonine protein kinase [Polyangiaceae bacterium]|nr:serine/threonine protein kinase [Polyangiaceae bacterium]
MSAVDEDLALAGAVLQQRWRLLQAVGAGGLGVVYESAPLSGEGRFAIKLLRREFCGTETVVDRFLGEVEASSRVDHPGVVRVVEHGRAEDGTPYLVMPLLEGESLSTAMNRGRMPVQRATAIGIGLLDALGAAHASGVVHRDLKPDNVFLVKDTSGTEQVRILDFGLAKVVDVAGGPTRRTRTGVLLGTPGYMSPEQVRNAKEAGPQADLWSVAIILFEMLTGVRAYVAANEFERMTKMLVEGPPSIANVAPQYAHWETFFARALACEVGQRFADAVGMRAALEHVARGGRLASATDSGGTLLFAPVHPSDLSAHRTGVFGGVNTTVSPGASGPPAAGSAERANVDVRVVQLPPRGFSLTILLIVASGAWVFGFVAGYLLGAR